MTKSEKRYIVENPVWHGSFYEQFGWRVVDTQAPAPEFRTIATTSKPHAQQWARSLNNRK